VVTSFMTEAGFIGVEALRLSAPRFAPASCTTIATAAEGIRAAASACATAGGTAPCALARVAAVVTTGRGTLGGSAQALLDSREDLKFHCLAAIISTRPG